MGKLTKRQRRELELIRLDLVRAKDFIMNDRVAVCRVGGPATTTLHMERKLDGKVFYEINRDYGSNLCGLEEGIRKLDRMLKPDVEMA
jgi:hypothetical protein